MIKIDCCDDLAAIPAREWNGLSGVASFYLSHQWLAAQDAGQPVEPVYFTAWLDGRLVGALPTYLVRQETNDFYDPARCADGRWTGRYLLAGARRAYANDVLTAAGLDDAHRDRVIAALLAAADRRRVAHGLDGTLLLYLNTAAARRVTAVTPASVPVFLTAEAVLDLPGSDFSAYLDSLPTKRRCEVRRESARFESAGLRVAEVPVQQWWPRLAEMFGAVQRRYGHDAEPEHWRRVIHRQTMRVHSDAVMLGCLRGSDLIGAVLLYPWRDTCYAKLIGLDYPSLTGRFEYFNLGYYAVIQYAYRHGLRRAHFGREAVEAKVHRGARLYPLWAVAIGGGQGGDPAASADAWNRQAGVRWRDQYGWARHAFADPGWSMWGLSGQPVEAM